MGSAIAHIEEEQVDVRWSVIPFSRGEYRRCHSASVRNSQKPLVVKTYRNRRFADHELDFRIFEIANMMAEAFNELPKVKRKVHFVAPVAAKVRNPGLCGLCCAAVQPGDDVSVEPRISGKYEKFISNNGTLLFQGTLGAFTHFTYWKSKKKLIVVDLQGVRSEKEYTLTDPAIHSVESLGRGYGDLDLGTVGIEAFFRTHKCSKLCKALPKPEKARYDYLDCERIMKEKKSSAYVSPQSASYL